MIKSAVVSSCAGRIRLRHKAFQKQNFNAEIESIEQMKGLSSVEYNMMTGSILIVYKPKVLSEKDLHTKIKALFSPYLENYVAPAKKSCNSLAFACVLAPAQNIAQDAIKRYGKKKCGDFLISAMTTTLIPSVALGFMGSKRWHILLGGAFLVFVAGHTLLYSKKSGQEKKA